MRVSIAGKDTNHRPVAPAQGDLAADIESGKLQPPPHGPRGDRQPPSELLEKYDVNKDGKLDETECAAIKADIEAGKLHLRPATAG